MKQIHFICLTLGVGRLSSSFLAVIFITLLAGSALARAEVFVRSAEASTTLQAGSVVSIHWNDNLAAENVDIELWDGVRGTSQTIASGIGTEQRELTWTIPPGTSDGSRYRFIVRDSRRPHRLMSNVGFLTILGAAPQPTSIADVDAVMGNLEIAPMPASERIRLSWTRVVRRIEIVDARGMRHRTVTPAESSRNCTVDVADLAVGAYTVQLCTSDGRMMHRPLIIAR